MPTSIQLRQYIRSVIAEGAVTPQQAQAQGLALYVATGNNGGRMYVLYDATRLIDIIELGTDTPAVSCVKAMMSVDGTKKNVAWGAAIVRLSAADRGYGPLIYDIVMAQEGGLTADRGSVSKSAQRVWQYYKDSRPDVVAKPLDDEDDPKTEPKIDDARVHNGGEGNPLNYAYFATRKFDITPLRKKHYTAIKDLSLLGLDADDLQDLAVDYFNRRAFT